MGEPDNLKLISSSINGFSWRFFQLFSTQILNLVLQIILARILLPADYGLVALTSVINSILTTIVTTGFSSSIVQKKELTEIEKSSMFFVSVILGSGLYCIAFFLSPLVSRFYNQPILTSILRVQTISILIMSFSSVHNATLQRKLDYKKTFFASFLGVVFQGAVGIAMAKQGLGVWSLVVSVLVSNAVNCVTLFIICKWKPLFSLSIKATKEMFSFSSKILLNNTLNTAYNSFLTLIIGKVYNAEMVGYYEKGFSFPVSLMNSVDGAMNSVLFSSLSRLQDDRVRFVSFMRKSMKTSLTIVTPLLLGMAAVSDPMVRFFLTDKWEGAIPFVMIQCILCLSWPLSARVHALNAIGKSGMNLLVNVLIKALCLVLILLSIPLGIYAMCLSSMIGTVVSIILYSIIISRHFDYSMLCQFKDVAPIYAVGGIMFVGVYWLSSVLTFSSLVKLLILIPFGAVLYIGISLAFKLDGFLSVCGLILDRIKSVMIKQTINR